MDDQQPSINNELFYQKPRNGYGYIYKYTSPSGKCYIGQTINSLKERAKSLINGNGYKKCTVFWKAIKKYGWSNFKVEILEEVKVDLLNDKEKYYILLFNSLIPNGYNLTIGGESGKTKEVYVYSAQNGNFIEHYSSLTEASMNTNVPIETISSILNINSPRKQAHNLIFTDSYVPKYDVTNLSRKNYHKVFVYDKKGNYLNSYESINSAAKALNIADSSIRKCFNGLSNHVRGYQFRDKQYDKIDSIPKENISHISVCQINPETQEIIATYPSMMAAARAVGLSRSDGIKKVITRGKGLSGGFFWKVNEGSTTKVE